MNELNKIRYNNKQHDPLNLPLKTQEKECSNNSKTLLIKI